MKYLKIILEFAQAYWDKITLGVLLIILSAVLVVQTDNLKATQDEVNKADQDLKMKLPTNKLDAVDESAYHVELGTEQEMLWGNSYGEGTLFDPGNYTYTVDGTPYILHITTEKNPYTGGVDLVDASTPPTQQDVRKVQDDQKASLDTDKDGIPDSVEITSGLNKDDPDDGLEDRDGDGFDNLEEYTNKTGISDPASRPPLITRVRLYKKVKSKLDLKLKKVHINNEPENKSSWDIEVKYKVKKRWKSDFLKVGSKISNTGYKVIDASFRESVKNGIPTEESEITIKKGDNDPIVAAQNATVYEGAIIYELIFLASKPIKIKSKIGEPFKVPARSGPSEKYLVVKEDSSSGDLIIKHVDSGKEYSVRKFRPEDQKRYIRK